MRVRRLRKSFKNKVTTHLPLLNWLMLFVMRIQLNYLPLKLVMLWLKVLLKQIKRYVLNLLV